ncbi:hypothetical protein DY000_02012619 [Brassica cretica]|nr:hypothetical protein DY000_02012619 [Brassica cretica]
MHSHNYRIPEPSKDQVVVLIGNSASAVDISRDIAGHAKEVHVAGRSNAADTFIKQPGYSNLWMHSMMITVWGHCTKISFLQHDHRISPSSGYQVRFHHFVCLSCKANGSLLKLAQGIPNRYTHRTQFEYNDWLASQCGCSETEQWRKEMYLTTGVRKRAHLETYRDEWEDHHLISQASQDFFLYTLTCNM